MRRKLAALLLCLLLVFQLSPVPSEAADDRGLAMTETVS